MIAGLAWMMPRMLPGVAWTRRFTLAERLLTEPRVLVDYIEMIVLWPLLFYIDASIAEMITPMQEMFQAEPPGTCQSAPCSISPSLPTIAPLP